MSVKIKSRKKRKKIGVLIFKYSNERYPQPKLKQKYLQQQVEKLKDIQKENDKLKEMLKDISSQLKDRGGFDVLTLSIDDKLKNKKLFLNSWYEKIKQVNS